MECRAGAVVVGIRGPQLAFAQKVVGAAVCIGGSDRYVLRCDAAVRMQIYDIGSIGVDLCGAVQRCTIGQYGIVIGSIQYRFTLF